MSVGAGAISLHCGDALDFLEGLPKASVDVFVTSPPDNLRNTSGGGMTSVHSTTWKANALRDGYDGYEDCMPNEAYVAWQRRVLAAMWEATTAHGAIFYNHKWRTQEGAFQRLADEITAGFPVRQIIIWNRKVRHNFGGTFFPPSYEVVYLLCKPQFRLSKYGLQHTDVWEIPPDRDNPHPAPFPVAFAERCIRSVERTSIVGDPFVGSGSTALAARRAGKVFVGCDQSEAYLALARQRLSLPEQISLLEA